LLGIRTHIGYVEYDTILCIKF